MDYNASKNTFYFELDERATKFKDYLVRMTFELISELSQVKVIAVGTKIRDIKRLRKFYGKGRWRKLKGIGSIRLASGRIRVAELH